MEDTDKHLFDLIWYKLTQNSAAINSSRFNIENITHRQSEPSWTKSPHKMGTMHVFNPVSTYLSKSDLIS